MHCRQRRCCNAPRHSLKWHSLRLPAGDRRMNDAALFNNARLENANGHRVALRALRANAVQQRQRTCSGPEFTHCYERSHVAPRVRVHISQQPKRACWAIFAISTDDLTPCCHHGMSAAVWSASIGQAQRCLRDMPDVWQRNASLPFRTGSVHGRRLVGGMRSFDSPENGHYTSLCW